MVPGAAAVELPPRYRLLNILKETDTTAVYQVWDAVDDREEALKILRSELSGTQQILQFRSEVATLAGLNHPNVVRIFDFGLLQKRFPYFSMEYVEGKRLPEIFDGSDWDGLIGVALQAAIGLQHIHQRGIIHFDLKPSNLLVDAEGKLKITDFGVAAEASDLFDRRIRGTFHYMAPEVLRQEEVDARAANLWSEYVHKVGSAAERYGRTVPPASIPRQRTDRDAGDYLDVMQRDKKARGGQIRFVLNRGIGASDLFTVDDLATLLPELLDAAD